MPLSEKKGRTPLIHLNDVQLKEECLIPSEVMASAFIPQILTISFNQQANMKQPVFAWPFTKKIMEQHGGKIRVEAEDGNGCKFFFTVKKYASNQ